MQALYYNADIWLLPTLSPQLKQKLLSASASALKISTRNYDRMVSFEQLHTLAARANPTQMTKYRHSLLLHKVYNDQTQSKDWLDMNQNQNFNGRLTRFKIIDCSNYKIGKNLICNRLKCINDEVELSLLNLSFNAFKIKMKTQYLS